MPKERIRKSSRDGFADLLVQWGRDEVGDRDEQPKVRLFIIASEFGIPGCFWFEPRPDNPNALPENAIGKNGEMVGPVDIMLDREQVNRAIRVLRRARDAAYGRDE